MARIANVHVFRMRHKLQKFLHMRLLYELRVSTAYEQHRDLNPARRFLQSCFELSTIHTGGAWTVEKARVPMPTPPPVGRSTQILL